MTLSRLNLTICVVLYRSTEISRRFAAEISASLSQFSNWEIIFYDNSPSNELSDLAAYGTYHHDPDNRGFSFANNQAILSARYENIALINPDVFGFDADFWARLSKFALGKTDVRFVKLLNVDGSHQDCVGQITSLSRLWRPSQDYAAMTSEHRVGMGIMAFMLTTRNVFARVGLLDCDYALFAEDMDWCQRAHQASIPVIFDPQFCLTHLGGASAGDRWSLSQTLKKKYRAEQTFINKHRRGLGWFALRVLNAIKLRVRT